MAPTPGTAAMGIGILNALRRFDHHNGDEVTFEIQRPYICTPLVL
jgi:hypothetical protein